MNKLKELAKEDSCFNYYLDEKIWNEKYKKTKKSIKTSIIIDDPIIIDTEQIIII